MKYILICLCLLLLPILSPAQKKKFNKKQFTKDSVEIMKMGMTVRPQLRIDNRMTYYKGQTFNLNGFDAGVLLKEKLRLALGYYVLNDNLSAYTTKIDGADVKRVIKLQYVSINTEYFYYNKRFLSLGLPLDFGFGKNSLSYKNVSANQNFDNKSGFVCLTDFGASAIFKPTRWIGVKGVLGYRKFLIIPAKDLNFDGVFVSLGLSVDIREIVKDIRMYKLKKKYKRGKSLDNAIDLITD